MEFQYINTDQCEKRPHFFIKTEKLKLMQDYFGFPIPLTSKSQTDFLKSQYEATKASNEALK